MRPTPNGYGERRQLAEEARDWATVKDQLGHQEPYHQEYAGKE